MAKAWLYARDQGRPIAGEFNQVFSRAEAAEMSYANAQQIMRTAEDNFLDYTWRMVEVRKDVFIVEGDPKK